MAEVTVLFDIKEEPVKEKIHRELFWYDIIKQEMLIFNGGKLNFKYKKDDYLVKMSEKERQSKGILSIYRTLPEVEDIIICNYAKTVKVTNQEKIEDWFFDYNTDHNSLVEGTVENSIIFNVPDNEYEGFCDNLEGHGFRYE